MTNQEVKLLSSLLSLSGKILKNDQDVEDDINGINEVTATGTDNDAFVLANVNQMLDSANVENQEVANKVINNLNVLADKKELMLGLLEARCVRYGDLEGIANFVDKALVSGINNYQYWNNVVMLAISLKDPTRIKAAADKILPLEDK